MRKKAGEREKQPRFVLQVSFQRKRNHFYISLTAGVGKKKKEEKDTRRRPLST